MRKRDNLVGVLAMASAIYTGYMIYRHYVWRRKKSKQAGELKREGNELYSTKNYEMAIGKYIEAEDRIVNGAPGQNEAELVKIYNNMSQAYFMMADYGKSVEYIRKALKINPMHRNSFKRLAELEAIGRGAGGVDGLAGITAYILLLKREGEGEPDAFAKIDTSDKRLADDVERYNKVLDAKTDELIGEVQRELPDLPRAEDDTNLKVPIVKLEETISIFKGVLQDRSFDSDCEAGDLHLHELIERGDMAGLIARLENDVRENACSKLSSFLIGNIKYIQDKTEQALAYLKITDNSYSAVLSMYIDKVTGKGKTEDASRLKKILENKDDPVIRIYLSQIELYRDNIGKHFLIIEELEKDGVSALSFIIKSRSQLEMKEASEAIATIERGMELFPQDANLLSMGIELFSRIIEDKGPKVGVDEVRGRLKRVLGKIKGAPQFEGSARLAFFCYIGYQTIGETEPGIKCLEKAISLDCYNSSLLVQAAHLKLSGGDEEGFEYFLRAASISTREESESILRTMFVYQTLYAMHRNYPEVAKLAHEGGRTLG